MTKIAKTLGAVYIYIYIVRFNRINLCKRSKKLCVLSEPKFTFNT